MDSEGLNERMNSRKIWWMDSKMDSRDKNKWFLTEYTEMLKLTI